MANASRVSLVPTEHGAYVQLGLALVSGLLLGNGNARAWGQAALSVLLFLASAPALALLEQRVREDMTGRVRGLLLAYGLLSLLAAGLAWLGAPSGLSSSLAVPAALAAGLSALAFRGRLHTVAGELGASLALSSSAYPVSLLGGAPNRSALLLTLCLAGIHAIGTATVRAFLVSLRRKGDPLPRAIPPLLGLLLGSLTWTVPVPRTLLLAFLPTLAAALWVLVAPPSPRHMKRLGWLLTTASAAGLVPLLLSLPR